MSSAVLTFHVEVFVEALTATSESDRDAIECRISVSVGDIDLHLGFNGVAGRSASHILACALCFVLCISVHQLPTVWQVLRFARANLDRHRAINWHRCDDRSTWQVKDEGVVMPALATNPSISSDEIPRVNCANGT